jgi:hypothetical protein
MYINHQGIGTGRGLAYSLAAGLIQPIGHQASWGFYNRLAKQTPGVQGQADVCGAGDHAIGVFVDCSPKGDSATVETTGFEWVTGADADIAAAAVGNYVTTGADGKLVRIAGATATPATNVPTLAEVVAGCWMIDAIDAVNKTFLIGLDSDIG